MNSTLLEIVDIKSDNSNETIKNIYFFINNILINLNDSKIIKLDIKKYQKIVDGYIFFKVLFNDGTITYGFPIILVSNCNNSILEIFENKYHIINVSPKNIIQYKFPEVNLSGRFEITKKINPIINFKLFDNDYNIFLYEIYIYNNFIKIIDIDNATDIAILNNINTLDSDLVYKLYKNNNSGPIKIKLSKKNNKENNIISIEDNKILNNYSYTLSKNITFKNNLWYV